MVPYKILLADDHSLFREGLKRILESEPGYEIVGEVGDGLELLEFLSANQADLVILDISMPNLDGIEALKQIKTRYPKVKVLILTMYHSVGQLILTSSSGSDGYLLKENILSDLFSAISNIRQGGQYISNLMSDQIVSLFNERYRKPMSQAMLTQRDVAILTLLCQEKTRNEIAEYLSLSRSTIHNECVRLQKKLNVKTVGGLIKYALKNGLAYHSP